MKTSSSMVMEQDEMQAENSQPLQALLICSDAEAAETLRTLFNAAGVLTKCCFNQDAVMEMLAAGDFSSVVLQSDQIGPLCSMIERIRSTPDIRSVIIAGLVADVSDMETALETGATFAFARPFTKLQLEECTDVVARTMIAQAKTDVRACCHLAAEAFDGLGIAIPITVTNLGLKGLALTSAHSFPQRETVRFSVPLWRQQPALTFTGQVRGHGHEAEVTFTLIPPRDMRILKRWLDNQIN